MLPKSSSSGVTLLELLLVVAVLALLSLVAVPSIQALIDKNQLRHQIQNVRQFILAARTEALKSGLPVYITTRQVSDMSWCLGYSAQPDCYCDQADVTHNQACTTGLQGYKGLRTLSSTSSARIHLQKSFNPIFSALHGGVRSPGRFTFSLAGYQAQIRVALSGRVSVCDEHNNIGGWNVCP